MEVGDQTVECGPPALPTGTPTGAPGLMCPEQKDGIFPHSHISNFMPVHLIGTIQSTFRYQEKKIVFPTTYFEQRKGKIEIENLWYAYKTNTFLKEK